jgi:non-heme chloroperoxidase
MASVTTSDGVRLNYVDEGEGPPVLLLAGFAAPLEMWELQRRALRAAGYRVIGLDRRSHGGSDKPAYGQRMARHGKDLRDVLEALELDDVVVVGGSMGASTVWAYCDLYGDDRLRGVVSVDQTPKMVNDESWPYGFYGLDRTNVGTFFAAGIPDTGRGLRGDRMAGLQRVHAALGGRDLRFSDPQAPDTRPLLQNHVEADWRDVIARLRVPSLFLAGRESQFWPCQHALAAAATNERARAVVLDDCGHAANLDQPDLVNAAILGFLR